MTQLLIYVPCFLGSMLALNLARDKVQPIIPAFLWPGAICAVCSIFAFLHHAAWQRKVIYPEWIMCAALGLLIPLFREISSKGILGVLVARIAKYSHGIYLVHVPTLWVSLV